jgi:hypothetical protein
LTRIIQDVGHEVALLKLDCEGSEYDIIQATPREVWQRIREIRMEYHAGRVDELLWPLEQSGFRVTLLTRQLVGGAEMGNLWLSRS